MLFLCCVQTVADMNKYSFFMVWLLHKQICIETSNSITPTLKPAALRRVESGQHNIPSRLLEGQLQCSIQTYLILGLFLAL